MLPRAVDGRGRVGGDEAASEALRGRRERREQLRRTQQRRRRVALGVLVALLTGSGAALAWRPWSGDATPKAAGAPRGTTGTTAGAIPVSAAGAQAPRPGPKRMPEPAEVRGVHITHYLAGDDRQMQRFYRSAGRRDGLNAIQVDIKDEAGVVGFDAGVPLARRVGAVQRLYNPRRVARDAHRAGLYVIGRVVMFEDPIASVGDPTLAIRTRGGGVWKNRAGLGWTNPYNRRVWQYGIDLARAAGRAGFDEIQFDYVRFPTDGDISSAVFRPKRKEPYAKTIGTFLRTATAALHADGLKVSADLFGLAATRDLHIGQLPRTLRNVLDAVSPMAYPSHYGPGEYGIPNPDAAPARTMTATLRDWRAKLRGGTAKLRPWIQDFSLGVRYGTPQVKAQIKAVRAATKAGFLIWNAGVVYSPGVLVR